MEFKKKTIIWEDNNEPPKNYIWVKSDGNAYEFNHTTRQWEKIMSSNGSHNSSSNNSIDEIVSFIEGLENEGMVSSEWMPIEYYDEMMRDVSVAPYKTYGDKDTAFVFNTYFDPNTIQPEPSGDLNIKYAVVFLSEEDYNKGLGWKFDWCWYNGTFNPIGPDSNFCYFLAASEYPKILYRNLIEEIEPSLSIEFQYILTNGYGSLQDAGITRDNFRVFSCEINNGIGTTTLRLAKFEYDGKVWYAPLESIQEGVLS